MMNSRRLALIIAAVTLGLSSGCYQRIDDTSTSCDQLGKTTDPAVQADLEKRCGHGGPAFKPTPKTRTY